MNELLEKPDDVKLAYLYIQKCTWAHDKGHEFTLSFSQYKKLVTKKRCAFSGIEFTPRRTGKQLAWKNLTLDRLNNELGYTNGNVAAVCHGINKLKGTIENDEHPLTIALLEKTLKNIKKL